MKILKKLFSPKDTLIPLFYKTDGITYSAYSPHTGDTWQGIPSYSDLKDIAEINNLTLVKPVS